MTDDHQQQQQQHQHKTRNKPSLSCSNCRKRKTKCDRKQPCSSCVKKINLAYSCTYDHPVSHHEQHLILTPETSTTATTPSNSRKRQKVESPDSTNTPQYEELVKLRKRIQELEASLSQKSSPASTSSRNQAPILSPTSSSCPNPIVDDDDMINFYNGYTPIQIKRNIRRVNFGPLSWIALMKKDPALCLAWKALCSKGSYCIITNKWPQLNPENIALLNSPQNLQEENNSNYMDKVFKKRVLEFEGYDEIVPYKSMSKNESTTPILNSSTNNNGPVINFTQISLAKSIFDGRINPELHLIEQIKQIVPKKKVFWTLIDRFFTDIYPFFPFVDEEVFKKELSRIFGAKNYDDVPFESLRIDRKLDLAHIAVCFILLRLTYLSFFNNRNCINEYIMKSDRDTVAKYIMSNPINLSSIEVANSCIQCFQFTRKSNMTVFQAMLYMRIYRNCAPEESDGIDGGDSQVGTALLVQMAYSLGLHREPDKFDVCNDERVNHLGRKMWNFLVRSDLTHCYTLGNPTSIDHRHYDVKPPFVNDTNSNADDREMEMAVVDTFVYLNSELDSMRKMLDYVLDINNGAKVNDVTRDLHEFEVILHDYFNVLGNPEASQVSTNREDIIQYYHVIKLRIFLSMKTALTSLYYHVYLHYEKNFNSELSFFYLSKMYHIIREDLIPAIGHTLVGKYSSRGLILNTNMQLALHKINQINLSCLIRVSYLVRMFETSPDHASKMESDSTYKEHFARLSSLLKNIRKTGDFVKIIMERIGSKYYYSWRIAKAHGGLFNVLTEPENYDKYLGGIKKIKAFQFTPRQLSELDAQIRLLGKCAEKLVYYEDNVDLQPNFDIPMKPADVANLIHTTNTNAISPPGSNAANPDTPSVKTPFSSIGSPRLEAESVHNDYIDQMWLSMVAMKYDPTLENPLSGNLIGNGNVNGNAQNKEDSSCDNEACPVNLNHRDNGNTIGNSNQLLHEQQEINGQQQAIQQQFAKQMQLGTGTTNNGGYFVDPDFDLLGDYFYG